MQPPGSGSLSQVLTMLRKLPVLEPIAGQTLITQQLQAIAAENTPGASRYTIRDHTTGKSYGTIDLAEEDPTGALLPADWMDTGFAHIQVAENLKLEPPFPVLELIAQPGGVQTGKDGQFESEDIQGQIYNIDAVVFADGDLEQFVQRKALVLAEAFARVTRLDTTLGGLVQMVRTKGSVEQGGGGRHGSGSLVMAARVRLEIFVLLPF